MEEFIANEVQVQERREKLGLRFDTASWAPLSDNGKWTCADCKVENVSLQDKCVLCDGPKATSSISETKPKAVCAICMDAKSEESMDVLSCGHEFHKSCIGALRTHGVKAVCAPCRMVQPSGPEVLHDQAGRLLVRAQRSTDEKVNKLALFEQAEELLRQVCNESPEHPMAHGNLGYVLGEKGDLEGARGSFQRALKITPRDAWIHCSLGNTYQDLGDFSSAKASMQQAIEINPKDAAAHCNLGTALLSSGDCTAAISAFQKAIEIEPQYGDAHCNLGSALGSTGDLEGAARSLRTAIVMDHRNAEAHCNLGTALLNMADYDGALKSYKEMLAMDPHGPHAEPARQGLQMCIQLKEKMAASKPKPAATDDGAICNHCGGGGATMRCGRCKAVKYCSGKCQKAHWKAGHKSECATKPSSS
jgi:tetratricopeptide (TPR) repeat protein